MGTKMKR
jgi:hypothetical protein